MPTDNGKANLNAEEQSSEYLSSTSRRRLIGMAIGIVLFVVMLLSPSILVIVGGIYPIALMRGSLSVEAR